MTAYHIVVNNGFISLDFQDTDDVFCFFFGLKDVFNNFGHFWWPNGHAGGGFDFQHEAKRIVCELGAQDRRTASNFA